MNPETPTPFPAQAQPMSDVLPARAPGILGKLLVLCLFLALVGSLAQQVLDRPLDWSAKQREYFGEGGLPAGLAFESGLRLPTGDVVVRFMRTAQAGGAARELTLLEYARAARAEAAMRPSGRLAGLEAAQRLKEWEADKSTEWIALMKRGEVAWGEWRAPLVIERSFQAGGGWREEARVDLSTKERPLVLSLRWPAGQAADEAELRALLAMLHLAPAGS